MFIIGGSQAGESPRPATAVNRESTSCVSSEVWAGDSPRPASDNLDITYANVMVVVKGEAREALVSVGECR
jgi:hypothetical protein